MQTATNLGYSSCTWSFSGFEAFKEELGPSRDSTLPKGTKIDVSYMVS